LDEALATARRQGAQYLAEILKSPDMLPGRAFASLIDASPETVNQKRKVGDLLGLEGATRGVRFPKWQVTDDGRPLPGPRSLFGILGGDPWTVLRFLTQKHNELAGETGLQAIKAGRLKAVQDLARNLEARRLRLTRPPLDLPPVEPSEVLGDGSQREFVLCAPRTA
jgi:hypothetical protein